MKQLTFWFDVVSPYAYLAFQQLPQALEGCSYSVNYRPLLLAGLLKHWGQKGPAELAPKRAWTYRQVSWLARRLDVDLRLPSQHPFNPLPLLRLGLACAPAGGTPSRYVVDALFGHVWRSAADANDAERLSQLTQRLKPARDPAGDAVRQELHDAGAQAIALDMFGVPTVECEGRLFWGLDGLDMLAAYLRGDDPWFDGPAWDDAALPRPGVVRRS